MNDIRWHQLVSDIEADDIELMVEACEHLQNEADHSDIPRLLDLLQHESFVVREAAAFPLAVIGDMTVLPELFSAFQRGFDEGLDNDGFSGALIDLAQMHPENSRKKLLELKESPEPVFRKNVEWLLEFC